jgi:hypothetical protein
VQTDSHDDQRFEQRASEANNCSWNLRRLLSLSSPLHQAVVWALVFLTVFDIRRDPEAKTLMMKKTSALTEDDLPVDLTFHGVSASLLGEFAEKIVRPYYNGDMNAAIQDLLVKALAEQEFVHSRITHVRSPAEG